MAKIVVLATGDDVDTVKTALDGTGVEYEVVEPTASNLLHIAIGMLDESEEPAEEAPVEEPPAEEPQPEEAPVEEPPAEEVAQESLGQVRIDGEILEARLGNGPSSSLRAVKIESGPRTSYTINESTFSFWPSNPSAPSQRVIVEHGSHRTSVEVRIEVAEGSKSYFLVGKDLADLFKA